MGDMEIKIHLETIWTLISKKHSFLKPFRDSVYFAGGCIRSLVGQDKPKDYDLFFSDNKKMLSFLLYCKDHELGHITPNSVSFDIEGFEIQFIIFRARSPHTEVMEFDFTFNQNYYNLKDQKLHIEDEPSIIGKKMVINYECRNPFDTFFRIFKFAERGYTLPNQSSLDQMAVKLTRLDPIYTKQDFLNSTRRCTSAVIQHGKLDFLED